MDSPLLKYSAKEYFFKAALCHFCIDMLNAKVGDRARKPPWHQPVEGREGAGGDSPTLWASGDTGMLPLLKISS